MEFVRVSNLRCLADTPQIELKPVTFLVGANSSGKSTFLRLFPLLKQSLEGESLGGLTLNERYVSFGFFNEVLRHGANPPELRLQLGFSSTLHDEPGRASWQSPSEPRFQASCELSYVQRQTNPRFPRMSRVTITVDGDAYRDKVEVCSEEDGSVSSLTVNNADLGIDLTASKFRLGRNLIPRLRFEPTEEPLGRLARPEYSPIEQKLLDTISPFFHGNASTSRKMTTALGIDFGSPAAMLASIKNEHSLWWKTKVQTWTINTPAFLRIRNLIIGNKINAFIASAETFLTRLASSVNYFAPVRASVERDYLNRDVSVTSVDPVGSNVAIFLASLNEDSQENFKNWMSSNFGIAVYPEILSDGARIALKLKENGSTLESNLADTGFGFSQMLPFLVQIWSLSSITTGPKRASNEFARWPSLAARVFGFTVAIEQPELHLHPALQAKLADVIVSAVKLSKQQNIPIRFVLETHSQSMIERVGELVEQGRMLAEDVQVVLFEADQDNAEQHVANVRIATFGPDGVLTGWPFGFLSAKPA